MASAQINEEKRRLIEESQRYRRAMGVEFQNLKASTAWVPKTVGIVRATSPLLALAAPVLGLLFRIKKKKAEVAKAEHNGKAKQGMVAKAFLLFELFRKAKPFWDSFRVPRRRPAEKPKFASSRSTSVPGK